MPRNSQSPPSAVDSTSSDSVGSAPTPPRMEGGTGDDVIGQASQACDLDLDDVARLDGTRVGRGTEKENSSGVQGVAAGDVDNEVVHVPGHLIRRAFLDYAAVQVGTHPLAVDRGCRTL